MLHSVQKALLVKANYTDNYFSQKGIENGLRLSPIFPIFPNKKGMEYLVSLLLFLYPLRVRYYNETRKERNTAWEVHRLPRKQKGDEERVNCPAVEITIVSSGLKRQIKRIH
jgi:hypothetical protein